MKDTLEHVGLLEEQEPAEDTNEIQKARETISKAFQDDPDFKRGYIDNVAMLLYDRDYLKDPDIPNRNVVAEAILDLIFEDKR